jgi:hypothetical protein
MDEWESNLYTDDEDDEEFLGHDATPVEDEASYLKYLPPAPIKKSKPENPAEIGYPATLPIEIALNLAPVSEILNTYKIKRSEWKNIQNEPLFIEELRNAKELLSKEGMSFKMKAKLQSEELLRTSWQLIHSSLVPPNVKADLIKSTVRWAGYEAQAQQVTGTGVGFSININFPEGSNKGRLVEEG